MAQNLIQICTRALDRIGSFNVPTSIVGNDDDTALQLLAIAKDVGEELCRDYNWTDHLQVATVTTVADQVAYDRPSDFDRMVPDTMWETGNSRFMRGAATSRKWQAINNVLGIQDGFYRWRLARKRIEVFPTPGGVFEFNYHYLSSSYCTDLNGVIRADGWTDDTDLPLLPHDVYVAGIRYYFKKENNMPYGGAEAEFEAVLERRLTGDGAAEVVNLADSVVALRTGRSQPTTLNIPDLVVEA